MKKIEHKEKVYYIENNKIIDKNSKLVGVYDKEINKLILFDEVRNIKPIEKDLKNIKFF